MNGEAPRTAAILSAAGDARAAEAVSRLLRDSDFAPITLTTSQLSVRHRIDMEHHTATAALVLVLWSPDTIADPVILDLADIAARRHRLIIVETGARTPIGFDGQQAMKVKIGQKGLSGGEFRLRERIAVMTEAEKLAAPKPVLPFRLAPFLLDFGSLWLLFMIAAMGSDEWLQQGIGATICSVIAYLGGILFDRLSRKVGVPIRNYFLRMAIRSVGQILSLILPYLLLFGKTSSSAQLSLAIFGVSSLIALKSLPFLISKRLRRRLLA